VEQIEGLRVGVRVPVQPSIIIVSSSSQQASTAITRAAELGQDWQ